ncbi:MAG: glycosyltransferase family 39 protein [Gemmatimonadetes bacterium]|nr:glycosyltransferase family 39 protein [Gemmatimonadota bacterium]
MRIPGPFAPLTPVASRVPSPGRVTPVEWLLLVGAVVAGALLRAWQVDTLALTHFDEGVYAFSGYGIATGRDPALFPDQVKFSPPVYFTLVAAANLVGIAPEQSPFVVSIVVGVLTIPMLWWLVRGWFGAIAAAAAAWFLAMNEFHILMSRTALTDVTFALTFLGALGAVRWALDRGTIRAAALAGIPVGLAWNTKYHGWFALVIAAMVIAGQWRLQGRGWPATRQATVRWLVMSAVALGCYLPWMAFIQSQPGSSAGWVSYFATMLRLDWFGNFWQQVQQQAYLEGPWTRASAVAALAAAQLVAMGHGRSLAPWVPAVAAGMALLVGGASVPVLLMGVAVAGQWRRGMTTAAWILAALVVLWVVMAPVYHPYFRLLLPLAVTWFALGGAGAESLARPAQRPWPTLAVAGVALAVVGLLSPRLPDPSSPWRAARGLVEAADQLSARVPAGEPISVMGEPALAFYLHRRGHPAWERGTLEALDTLVAPRYLVTGIYQRRAPLIQKRFEARADQLELLARFPAGLPSDLRLLDNFLPDSARVWMAHPDTTYDLLLYRFTPRGARSR